MEFIEKLGFGTWQIAGENIVNGENIAWDSIDPENSKYLLKYAYDKGIRFFDTSNGYGKGSSESFIGETVSNLKGSVICTKFGWVMKDGNYISDFSGYNIEKSLEESLLRLNRSTVDYYLFHTPKPEDINHENIRVLEKLKSDGLIGEFGVSCTTLNSFEKYFEIFDKFECAYNPIFLNNRDYFDNHKLKNKIFIRSIFASGLLTRESDEYTERKFYFPSVIEESNKYNNKTTNKEERIKNILEEVNSIENVNQIIVGFRKEKQINEIINYGNHFRLHH